MKNTQTNKDQKIQKTPIILKTLFITSFAIFSPSCTSTQHRRESVKKIIQHESTLLTVLKEERESDVVSSKLKMDPVLSRAESHLKQAIEALLKANKTAKSHL